MDVLSRIIELARLRPILDLRCRLQGAFDIDHPVVDADQVPFHLVLEGSCMISIHGRRPLVLQAGDFLLLPKGDAHVISAIKRGPPSAPMRLSHSGMLPLRQNGEGEPDLDLLCGHFACDDGASSMLLDALPDPFHASLSAVQSESTLKALAGILRDETVGERPGALAVATGLCLVLLALALRAQGTAGPDMPGLLSLLADQRLSKALQAMVREPGRDWTIDGLAALCAMSRPTFARHFKESAGTSPHAFLRDLRMSIAGDALVHTRRSIADIAADVGYASEAAFGKTFKASMGITPARFRHRGARAV